LNFEYASLAECSRPGRRRDSRLPPKALALGTRRGEGVMAAVAQGSLRSFDSGRQFSRAGSTFGALDAGGHWRPASSFDDASSFCGALDAAGRRHSAMTMTNSDHAGSAVFSARGTLDGTLQSVRPVIDASYGDGAVRQVLDARQVSTDTLPLGSPHAVLDGGATSTRTGSKVVTPDTTRRESGRMPWPYPPEGPVLPRTAQPADPALQQAPQGRQLMPPPTLPSQLDVPMPPVEIRSLSRVTPFDSMLVSRADSGMHAPWARMATQESQSRPTPFDSAMMPRSVIVSQPMPPPPQLDGAEHMSVFAPGIGQSGPHDGQIGLTFAELQQRGSTAQPTPFDSRPALAPQRVSVMPETPFDSRPLTWGQSMVTPLECQSPGSGGQAFDLRHLMTEMPPTMPERPDVQKLERAIEEQREQELDERLRSLERLQRSAALALGTPSGGTASAWRPGGRDFQEVYVTQPLAGFYVDKSRVALREAYLASKTYLEQDQEYIDWFACISSERRETRMQVLQQHGWRERLHLDSESDDDY